MCSICEHSTLYTLTIDFFLLAAKAAMDLSIYNHIYVSMYEVLDMVDFSFLFFSFIFPFPFPFPLPFYFEPIRTDPNRSVREKDGNEGKEEKERKARIGEGLEVGD